MPKWVKALLVLVRRVAILAANEIERILEEEKLERGLPKGGT